tara:strand:- start:219 stop:986 length:768 start_codon:yes stop_codon:yes gene_type:complete
MLRPRLIPCLLLANNGLVKTIKFQERKYIGDPLNTVRIFNEKKVDEIIILDIDATKCKKDPDYQLIKKISKECSMPLCYGGGLKNINQIESIINLGVEKIALGTEALKNPKLVQLASNRLGKQSVVVLLNIQKANWGINKYKLIDPTNMNSLSTDIFHFINLIQEYGVGEIIIQSVDRDGTREGYDINLIRTLFHEIDVPISVLGGAGRLSDCKSLYEEFGIIGASAGSLFTFVGKFRAVLIQYPDEKEKIKLFQ